MGLEQSRMVIKGKLPETGSWIQQTSARPVSDTGDQPNGDVNTDNVFSKATEFVSRIWRGATTRLSGATGADGVLSPRQISGPKYKIETLATLPKAPMLQGRPSLDGSLYAIQLKREFGEDWVTYVADLEKPSRTWELVLSGAKNNPDPVFTENRLTTIGRSLSINTITDTPPGRHDWVAVASREVKSEFLEFDQNANFYQDPNSRFVVSSNHVDDHGPGGPNPNALTNAPLEVEHTSFGPKDQRNIVRLVRWDEKKSVTSGAAKVVHVPGEWDFTANADGEPKVVGRYGKVNEPGQEGYVIYDVDPNKLELKKSIKIETLPGGKAKLMDNLIAIHHVAEPKDFKIYGFQTPDDPEFQKLVKTKSADVFVYNFSENSFHRVTRMGPDRQAWFPAFFRDEMGQPGLTYLTRDGSTNTYAIQRAMLPKDAAPKVFAAEPVVNGWSEEKSRRLQDALSQYLEGDGASIAEGHGAAHEKKPGGDEQLLKLHRPMVHHFEHWLETNRFSDLLVDNNGIKTLPAWRPNMVLPAGIDPRTYKTSNPRIAPPEWIGTALAGAADPVFGYQLLGQFENPEQLSRALTSGGTFGTGYHGAVHTRLGGNMATKDAYRSPMFWLFHRHLDNIFSEWLKTPKGIQWKNSPEGKSWNESSSI